MEQRQEQLRQAQREFANKIAEGVKEQLVKDATSVYNRNLIKIMNAKAEEERRQRAMKKREEELAKAKADGVTNIGTEAEGWGRGSKMAEAREAVR